MPIDYTDAFDRRLKAGRSPVGAAVSVAEDYLDGKPRSRGKRRITRSECVAAFWTSGFLAILPPRHGPPSPCYSR